MTDTTLTIPSPARSIPLDLGAIDRAELQETTRWKYKRELLKMVSQGIDPGDHAALQAYASSLKSSRKQFLKSALRLATMGLEQGLKATATPQNIRKTQAALYRLEAMRDAVVVHQAKGKKAHTWLSQKQVSEITALCDDSLEGKRDWIVLGVLLGAGLRRDELASLTFDALKQQPMKGGKMRDVLEVTGKGAKNRVIPIKPLLGKRLREWKEITGGGKVARSMYRKSKTVLGESLTAVAIFQIVNKYGKHIGMDTLAPHDCRRTFAHLAHEAGVPLPQISALLGHESVATTQRYLDLSIDLENTASDFIPLSGD